MSTRAPRTQQERRDGTRKVLLDAAVESLIDVGFARTTTLEVQRRAGVSRGALLHHFPSKGALLIAAIEQLAELRGRELRARAATLPATCERSDAVLDLLWECFGGVMFQVAVELRAAARKDPELRQALIVAERGLRERILAQSRALFGAALSEQPGFERAIDLTLQFMIGVAMTAMLHADEAAAFVAGSPRVTDLISDWKALFPGVVAAANRRTATPRAAAAAAHPPGEP
ncbi:MAG: TetR/AcrR family transcriptional regulator [Kofleriaceae bacterium]